MSESERAERAVVAATVKAIVAAARAASPPLSGAYLEHQALFIAGEHNIRANALLVVARNAAAPLPEGNDPWLPDIEFLRGRCCAWAIEVEQGGRGPEALTRLAQAYAGLHNSRQPWKPMPLVITSSLEERSRTQEAWRAGWPGGSWLIATYEEMQRGQLVLYHDGVLAPRVWFTETPLPVEEWSQ